MLIVPILLKVALFNQPCFIWFQSIEYNILHVAATFCKLLKDRGEAKTQGDTQAGRGDSEEGG